MNANADAQSGQGWIVRLLLVQLFHPRQHRLRGVQCAGRVLLRTSLAQWQAKYDHQSISYEFVEEAAVLADDLIHRGEVSVEPAQHLRGRLAGTKRGKTADVCKHYRGDMLFAAERELATTLPDGLRDRWIDVAGEERHQLLALGNNLAGEQTLLNELQAERERNREQHGELWWEKGQPITPARVHQHGNNRADHHQQQKSRGPLSKLVEE